MKIEYNKQSVKYINSLDKPTKNRLKEAIEKIPEYDEIIALSEGRKDRKENGTISHNDINWD